MAKPTVLILGADRATERSLRDTLGLRPGVKVQMELPFSKRRADRKAWITCCANRPMAIANARISTTTSGTPSALKRIAASPDAPPQEAVDTVARLDPALAAVTRAVPTPAAGLAQSPETATADADAPAATGAQPTRLRLAQLALGFALAWLVVTIVGLRWVRDLRRARS